MTEIDDLSRQRGQLLEVISQASNDIKIIDDRLRILRSVLFEFDPDEVESL
jgi:hypothetical protein